MSELAGRDARNLGKSGTSELGREVICTATYGFVWRNRGQFRGQWPAGIPRHGCVRPRCDPHLNRSIRSYLDGS